MYSKTTAMLMLLGFCSGASNLQISSTGTLENHTVGTSLAQQVCTCANGQGKIGCDKSVLAARKDICVSCKEGYSLFNDTCLTDADYKVALALIFAEHDNVELWAVRGTAIVLVVCAFAVILPMKWMIKNRSADAFRKWALITSLPPSISTIIAVILFRQREGNAHYNYPQGKRTQELPVVGVYIFAIISFVWVFMSIIGLIKPCRNWIDKTMTSLEQSLTPGN